MEELIVTILPGADIQKVSGNLTARGFIVEQELAAIAVLTGQAEASSIADLAAVEGVAAVEKSQEVGIASADKEAGIS